MKKSKLELLTWHRRTEGKLRSGLIGKNERFQQVSFGGLVSYVSVYLLVLGFKQQIIFSLINFPRADMKILFTLKMNFFLIKTIK